MRLRNSQKALSPTGSIILDLDSNPFVKNIRPR